MIVQSRLAHERLLARCTLVRLGVPGDVSRVVLLIRVPLGTFDTFETGRGQTFTEPAHQVFYPVCPTIFSSDSCPSRPCATVACATQAPQRH